MSITYYSIAKKNFTASSGEISALASLIDPARHTWTMQITATLRVIESHNRLIWATASKELNWRGMKAGGPTATSETAA